MEEWVNNWLRKKGSLGFAVKSAVFWGMSVCATRHAHTPKYEVLPRRFPKNQKQRLSRNNGKKPEQEGSNSQYAGGATLTPIWGRCVALRWANAGLYTKPPACFSRNEKQAGFSRRRRCKLFLD
jgi:hypothetical protein